jgi:hypothetical protein
MKPLNIFQRCVRVWERTHPYNAVQMMRVRGEAEVERIAAAWNEVLGASGLGIARVVGRRFCYERAPRQEVAVVNEDRGGLEAYITAEMNRPFRNEKRDEGECSMPFRPFVAAGCREREGEETHYLGMAYQHWVADSVSMRMLLREWFCRLHDPDRVSGKPLEVPSGGYWRYFGPGRAGWHPVEGAMSIVHSMGDFARARRLEEHGKAHAVECSIHRLPEGMIELLRKAARGRRVTVNDLLLAALARACDEEGAAPRRSDRDLALGSIVDLRAMSGEDLGSTFSLFLGLTSVVIRPGALKDREQLLASIGVQNARQKETRAAQVSMLRMAAGFAQAQFLTEEQLAAFYRNYMPFFGGISNVNMNRSWAADYHPSRLLDYVRVAPTGPMVPLVMAVTTMGRRFSYVLTRRASVVDAARGKALAERFGEELTAWAGAG